MEYEPHAFDNLGAIERAKDKRDHLIGSAGVYDFAPTKGKPANRTHYFQGHRPACGAHSGTHGKDALDARDGKGVPNHTPREVWMNIKADGTSPSDGTSMDRIFTVLQKTGVVDFAPLGNDVTYDDAGYANILDLPASVRAQEGTNTISSYAYLQDTSFEGLKQAINDFGGVLILVRLCARFWTAANGTISWAAQDILPLVPPSAQWPIVSSHFMWSDYYDENYLYGANSFGETWGLGGDFQMGRDYIPFVVEAGVMHNASTLPAVSAIATVHAALPQLQEAIQQLPSLTPAQQQEHIGIIQQLMAALRALLKASH